MAISVSQAFKRTSANPIDETIALTKAQMLTINDNLMPSKYLTVCQDDGLVYLYDKSATPDATTGKFKKFEGGSGHKIVDTDGTTVADEDKLQFIGLDVKDNSADGETEVESFELNSDSLDDVTDDAIQPSYASGIKYSADEQVIGQWIDGKPLYQKTLSTAISKTNNQYIPFTESVGMMQIVSSFFIREPSKIIVLANPMRVADSAVDPPLVHTSIIQYIPSTQQIQVFPCAEQYDDSTLYLTIQYTKTTD